MNWWINGIILGMLLVATIGGMFFLVFRMSKYKYKREPHRENSKGKNSKGKNSNVPRRKLKGRRKLKVRKR